MAIKREIPSDLPALAEILAQWVDDVPGLPAVYLFGSRVRGDHKPNSDVDVWLDIVNWKDDPTGSTISWWEVQNETDFAELKSKLPGPLQIGREAMDWTNPADLALFSQIKTPVLKIRKALCLWTPRVKPLEN